MPPPTHAQTMAQAAAAQQTAAANLAASNAAAAAAQAQLALLTAQQNAPAVQPVAAPAAPAAPSAAPAAARPSGHLSSTKREIETTLTTTRAIGALNTDAMALVVEQSKSAIETAKAATELQAETRRQRQKFTAAADDAAKQAAFDALEETLNSTLDQHGRHISDSFVACVSVATAVAATQSSGRRSRASRSNFNADASDLPTCSYCGRGKHALVDCYQRQNDQGRGRNGRRSRSRSPAPRRASRRY